MIGIEFERVTIKPLGFLLIFAHIFHEDREVTGEFSALREVLQAFAYMASCFVGSGSAFAFNCHARALSFDIEANRYRQNNRRKALAIGDSEGTEVHLCALWRCSYLDKKGCCSWPPDINGPITKDYGGSIRKSRQRMT